MSCKYQTPSPNQYLEFLLGKRDLDACIRRAYRDFCRTLKGGVLQPDWFKEEFMSLPTKASSQKDFDAWHRCMCKRLQTVKTREGSNLSVGHTQKWINMTLKYVFAFGEKRIPGYKKLYKWAHVPLDNVILNRLKQEVVAFGGLSTSWSKLTDYEEYFNVQKKIREKFPECAPMTLEFYWWQDGGSRRDKDEPT